MSTISRDTFRDSDVLNKLKRYVNVRMQEGVPLIDADWNEQDDIRKFEVEAFLKWYVGNGVPKDNDGFRIQEIENQIILTLTNSELKESKLEIQYEGSHAAEVLGFDSSNSHVKRMGPVPAQLTGKNKPSEETSKFSFLPGDELVITVNNFSSIPIQLIGDKTPGEVATAINDEIVQYPELLLKAEVGALNDLDIKGGDGTFNNPGRCLVEGWEAINEANLRYSSQPLHENQALADVWGVDKVYAFDPQQGQTATYFAHLDIWERQVNSGEDESLVNDKIGIESCLRMKREWAVRVLPEGEQPARNSHAIYTIARLEWDGAKLSIDDMRRTGLAVLSSEDIYIHDGDVHVTTALRLGPTGDELLRGDDPGTKNPVTGDANNGLLIQSAQTVEVNIDSNDTLDDMFVITKGSDRTELFRVQEDGKVGIGTTSPEAKLQIGKMMPDYIPDGHDESGMFIVNATQPPALTLLGPTDTGALLRLGDFENYLALEMYGNNDGDSYLNVSGTSSGFSFKVNGQTKMRVDVDGSVGIGTPEPKQELHVKGNAGVLDLEGENHAYIEWFPHGYPAGRKAWTGFGGAGTNDFTIRNEIEGANILLQPTKGEAKGRVGIGEANPAANLHISDTDAWTDLILENKGVGGKKWYLSSTAENAGPGQGKFVIYDGGGTDRLTIDASGNVGIGTTDPTEARLHVNGDIYASGIVYYRSMAYRSDEEFQQLPGANTQDNFYTIQKMYAKVYVPSHMILSLELYIESIRLHCPSMGGAEVTLRFSVTGKSPITIYSLTVPVGDDWALDYGLTLNGSVELWGGVIDIKAEWSVKVNEGVAYALAVLSELRELRVSAHQLLE